jgi:hypothetical protein
MARANFISFICQGDKLFPCGRNDFYKERTIPANTLTSGAIFDKGPEVRKYQLRKRPGQVKGVSPGWLPNA